MADQSVRTCHPLEFYYFRRSPLIPLLFALFFYLSRRTAFPSSRPSHPHNSSLPLHPFHPPLILRLFSFCLSLSLLSPFFLFTRFRPTDSLCPSLPFHLLVTSLLVYSSSMSLSRFDSRETREKDENERTLPACYVGERNKTATESRARLFWFRGCLFAPALALSWLNLSVYT